MPFRILSICDDDGLRYSRELLLVNEGYDADSVSSDAAISIMRARLCDAALICPSVPICRAMALDEMLRRYNPEIQIVHIASLESAEAYDLDSQISRRPERLLNALRHLSGRRAPLRRGPMEVAHRI